MVLVTAVACIDLKAVSIELALACDFLAVFAGCAKNRHVGPDLLQLLITEYYIQRQDLLTVAAYRARLLELLFRFIGLLLITRSHAANAILIKNARSIQDSNKGGHTYTLASQVEAMHERNNVYCYFSRRITMPEDCFPLLRLPTAGIITGHAKQHLPSFVKPK